MASSGSLPLHCSVCPKKPSFSDVSHLLTHVASKGHLSHYYKLKVRASQDLTARVLVDQYDLWYDQWSVEELMSQRMHQKERKKRSKGRTQEPTPVVAKQERPSEQALVGAKSRSLRALPVKQEAGASNDDVTDFFNSPPPKRAKLHLWDTHRPQSFHAIPLESSSPPANLLIPSSIDSDIMGRRSVDTSADPMAVDEAAKLKGAIWPGMDIFDSATPEMRRKRNQKKDLSVLDQLEQNSHDVKPMEVIYWPSSLVVKKSRNITGRVESSSPEPDDMPAPAPKRRMMPRRALNDRDVNTSAALPRQTRTRRPQPDNSNSRPAVPGKRHTRNFSVYRDDVEDFGNPRGMNVLTSEYRPQAQSNAQSNGQNSAQNHAQGRFHEGYAPAGMMPYLPLGVNSTNMMYSQNSYLPQQQHHQASAPGDLYGPYGYELMAFWARHTNELPFARLRQPFDERSPSQHDSASSSGTVNSTIDSFVQNGTTTTAATPAEYGVEGQDIYSSQEPPMFAEGLDGQMDSIVSLSELDHDLMQQTNNHH